ncbi:MAG TPA: Ldh family oxidoreductase [Burkholderiaceae bacterium]|nr:Ldh family oxidoreductase [Burkholderiaceae bacterium]
MNFVRIRPGGLHALASGAFQRLGYDATRAALAADVLHYADLRGLDTHGIANLADLYVPALRLGDIRVDAQPRWHSQGGACALLDAQGGLGLLMAQEAMEAAIGHAKDFGIGCVAVRDSTHFGAAGFYADMARRRGLLGLAMTNLGREPVAYPMSAARPLMGTNPIAFAAPGGAMPPFTLDMSTTVVAIGRIKQAHRREMPVPPGWLLDDEGAPVTEPGRYFTDGARLVPLGGGDVTQGGHKGWGLALMVEALCGALPGAHTPADQDDTSGRNSVGHFLLAIDPGFFRPAGDVVNALEGLLRTVVDAQTLPSRPPLDYPGRPDAQTLDERERLGVPLDVPLLTRLRHLAAELDLPNLEEA